MGNVYRSEHPTDADLLEGILARETDPHVAHCARCAQRAETIAREIDPVSDESRREPFTEVFYRQQAARIRARIAAGEGRPAPFPARLFLPGLPRRAWLGGAVAAGVALAVALHGRTPVGHSNRLAEEDKMAAVKGFQSAQDLADDRLLREIDTTLDEDPYDFGPVEG